MTTVTPRDFQRLGPTEQEFWRVTALKDGVNIEDVYLIEYSNRRITYHIYKRDGMGMHYVDKRTGQTARKRVRRCT